MLARRELTEAQVRQRLSRRGHSTELIDDAVTRLRENRSLDDERAAGAIARTEVIVRRRGRGRVRHRLAAAGITGDIAEQALESALEGVDQEALLASLIDRRLRHRTTIEDDAEFRRLFRYLVGQGFEVDRVLAHLRARRRRPT